MRVDFVGGSLDGKTFEIPEAISGWRVAILDQSFLEIGKESDYPEFVPISYEIYTDIGYGLFMMTRREKQ